MRPKSHLLLALLPAALSAPLNSLLPRQFSNSTTGSTDTPTPCSLATINQPSSSLLPPTTNLSLLLIAVGRGTQNYTCASPTSVPSAIGAIATLYDASCTLSADPNTATTDLPSSAEVGHHFFADLTTPEFDIDVGGLGRNRVAKAQEVGAPAGAGDIKWLRLLAKEGSEGAVKEVYRLGTVRGVAPASCEGVDEAVQVDYEAQYWFYG